MHTSIIGYLQAGKTMDDVWLGKAVNEFNSAAGVAFVDPKTKDIVLHVAGEGFPVGEVKKSLSELTDCNSLIWFGKNDIAYAPEDLQPFVLLTDANQKPLVVGFAEGEYAPYAKDKDVHSAEMRAAQAVSAKIKNLYDLLGGDMLKLIAQMEGAVFQQDIRNMYVNRGEFVFLVLKPDKTGHIIRNTENALACDTPFGWVSNRLGLYADAGTKQPDVAAPATEKKGGWWGRSKPPVVPAEAIAAGKTDTAIPTFAGAELMIGPPKDMGKNKLDQWYRKHVNFLPTNMKERPRFPLSAFKEDSSIRKWIEKALTESRDPTNMPTSLGQVVYMNADGKPSAEPKKDAHVPTPSPSNQPAPGPAPGPAASPGEEAPIITKEQKSHLIDKFFKSKDVMEYVDSSSTKILDPAKMQAIEAKNPTFFDISGRKMEETLFWGMPLRIKLAKECPELMALLSLNLASVIVGLLNETPKKVEVPAEPKKDVASPPPPAAKPASRWGGFKRTA